MSNANASFAFVGKVNEVLSKHTVKDVIAHHQKAAGGKKVVVSVLSTDSVARAFELLSENAVLSVPVLRSIDQEHEPLGFVDVLLIARYALGVLLEDPEDNAAAGALTAAQLDGVDLGSVTCADLLAKVGAGAVVPFFDQNPATYLPRLFTNHLHRTIVYSEVVKPDGVTRQLKMTGICSQTDLVRYLAALAAKDEPLNRIFEVSLREAGFKRQGAGQVASVHPTTTVIQALHKMSFLGFRAVAIAGDDGALVGTFSVESLRGLKPADLGLLARPVLDFVRERAPAALQPATVRTTDPTSGVLKMFASSGLHEAWVLGEDRQVEGVVTQTDLIHALAQRGAALDAAAEKHESREFAYPLPGSLFVKIASGASLSGGTLFRPVRAGVRASLGDETLVTTPTVPGVNPAWGSTFTLEVTPALARSHAHLTFEVFDESRRFEVLGTVKIAVKWIVHAFGTHQSALRNYADAFRIGSGKNQGEIQLEFVWLG